MKNGFINGEACTKAGENALQAICGEFDSHLLHDDQHGGFVLKR